MLNERNKRSLWEQIEIATLQRADKTRDDETQRIAQRIARKYALRSATRSALRKQHAR